MQRNSLAKKSVQKINPMSQWVHQFPAIWLSLREITKQKQETSWLVLTTPVFSSVITLDRKIRQMTQTELIASRLRIGFGTSFGNSTRETFLIAIGKLSGFWISGCGGGGGGCARVVECPSVSVRLSNCHCVSVCDWDPVSVCSLHCTDTYVDVTL